VSALASVSVAPNRIQIATASTSVAAIIAATGRLLWEPELPDGETWSEQAVGTETWTNVAAGSETWSDQSVGSETWSDIADSSNVWNEAA
jgi:hypothetical protein